MVKLYQLKGKIFISYSGWKSYTVEVPVVVSWADKHHTLLLLPTVLVLPAPVFDPPQYPY